MIIAFLVTLLFISELFYFRIADHYNIIDKPNHRSSHSKITIRGGGIIFPFAVILVALYLQDYYFFLAGLILISVISFADDVKEMPNTLRSLVQFIAVGLLLIEVGPEIPLYWYLLIFILIVGTINAWNFMDGVNGITGGYSLITLGALYYVNSFIHAFIHPELLLAVIASLFVFNFFNFRQKAKCFAGDVGSVSIAFIICFLLLQLIFDTGNLLFVGFLLIYGTDTVTTIFFRLIRKENIFQAHRSHFYQFLANEQRWPHLLVSGLYMTIQSLINGGVIWFVKLQPQNKKFDFLPLLVVCLAGGLIFVAVRWLTEGKGRLLGQQNF